MANPANPASNVAPRWFYQAILVEMAVKTLHGLRATQRHKEIRGIFNGGASPLLLYLAISCVSEDPATHQWIYISTWLQKIEFK